MVEGKRKRYRCRYMEIGNMLDTDKEMHMLENEYCCDLLSYELRKQVKIIEYNQKIREYAFIIPHSVSYMLLDYCVFCGHKLPHSLRHIWCDILRSEYKIQSIFGRDRDKIPTDFLTDEWWRQRNLNDENNFLLFNRKLKRDKRRQELDYSILQDRLNYKGPHCCVDMQWEIDSEISIIKYCSHLREHQVQSTGFLVLDFCPFCGKKEPQSLRKKWLEILKEDYGLVDPLKKDQKKVPQEFLTDEWWRERGL